LLCLLMTHRFATDEKRKRQHFQIFWSQPSDFLVCANFQSHIALRQHPPGMCFVKTSKTTWFLVVKNSFCFLWLTLESPVCCCDCLHAGHPTFQMPNVSSGWSLELHLTHSEPVLAASGKCKCRVLVRFACCVIPKKSEKAPARNSLFLV